MYGEKCIILRKLKFCLQTPHIYAKKVTEGMFEILSGGWDSGFFLGQTSNVMTITSKAATI